MNINKKKNVIKYREKFYKKIKELSSYFMKFSKDKLILFKKYLKSCIFKRLD